MAACPAPRGRLCIRLVESRPTAERMVFRTSQWELSPDGYRLRRNYRRRQQRGEKRSPPYGEEAARIFWQGRPKRSPVTCLPTRLTQARRSRAKAGNLTAIAAAIPKTKPRCPICGAAVTSGSSYCVKCVPLVNRDNLLLQAKLGRIATHSASAEARRSATQARQAQALRNWNPSNLPTWLDEDCYRRKFYLACPSSL